MSGHDLLTLGRASGPYGPDRVVDLRMSPVMSDQFPTDDPMQPRQPGTPPTVSPDGRFWWDGADWKPMPEGAGTPLVTESPTGDAPIATRAALASAAKRPWYKSAGNWVGLVAIAVLAFLVLGAVQGSREAAEQRKIANEPLDFFTPDEMDCDYLVHGAVRASHKRTGVPVHLLDVRAPKIVADYRQTYLPPSGAGESKVLVCTGVGVFDTGDKVPVKITGSVDADQNIWVAYKGDLLTQPRLVTPAPGCAGPAAPCCRPCHRRRG